MASLKLKNTEQTEFTVTHEDGVGAITMTSKELSKLKTVDTISGLRSLTEAPETLWVSGYHVKDDGAFGSNIFRWNDTSVEDDNGGTIIKLDSITTGRYELQYDGAVNVKWFGFSTENNAVDNTSIFNNALSVVSCSTSIQQIDSESSGTILHIPVGDYQLNNVTISTPVFIQGVSFGNFSNANERVRLVHNAEGAFFYCDNDSGYLKMENIELVGTKSGIVLADVDNNIFGNIGIQLGYGTAGTYKDMSLVGFDTGLLLTASGDDPYGGAYRYFEHLKFKDNTFHLVQKEYVTDSNFYACDFRGDSSQVYICTTSGYSTVRFNQCMLEGLKTISTQDKSPDTHSLIVKGKTQVDAIGCYFESTSIFVDTYSRYNATGCFYKLATATRHIGGGNIDISGSFPASYRANFPVLSDTSFWSLYNLTSAGIDTLDNVYCNKYTATADGTASIGTSSWNLLREISIDSITNDYSALAVQITYEYYTEGTTGSNLLVTCFNHLEDSVNISNDTHGIPDGVYNLASGWKKVSVVLPVPFVNTYRTSWIKPEILFENVVNGQAIGVKNLHITLLNQ